jgi:hypothetical protein
VILVHMECDPIGMILVWSGAPLRGVKRFINDMALSVLIRP